MTHDELLAAVQFNKQTLESSDRNSEALRAVVELPSELPEPYYLISDIRPEEIAKENYRLGYRYAMQTVIQAIEEQLK